MPVEEKISCLYVLLKKYDMKILKTFKEEREIGEVFAYNGLSFICLEASSIQPFNHPCKSFLSLLFIRTLRDLLVSEEDVVHTAVFAEVVHGLAVIDFDDLF